MQDNDKNAALTNVVDTKKIVTSVVSRAVDALLAPLEESARKRIAKTRNLSDELLRDYVLRKLEYLRSVKSLVHVDKPGDILQLYVPTSFFHGGKQVNELSFIDTLNETPRRVVQGTAGMGKSFFMRHLFVTESRSGRIGIPLYLDLRLLNESKLSILDFVLHEINHRSDPFFMKEQLELGIKSGIFTLLLDGLDELTPARLRSVQDEISDLAQSFHKAKIIVTSRPIDGPSSWNTFWLYELAPLNYKRARQVVERSGITPTVTKAFLDSLTPSFFTQHREFLHIPMLVIIMTLMFRENRDISSSLSTFYEDAYAALLSRHDATKELKRFLYCRLERSDFRAILNMLCATTYGRFLYQFREAELLEHITTSIASRKMTAKSEDFLNDLITSVCLIVRDGFLLKFSHRSFQEYFCASFIRGLDGTNAGKLLEKLGRRHDAVGVLNLIREMSSDLYEAQWLLPSLDRIRTVLAPTDPKGEDVGRVARVLKLLDIRVDGYKGTYDVTPSADYGRVLGNVRAMGEIPDDNMVSAIGTVVKEHFSKMYSDAMEKAEFELAGPIQRPERKELLEVLEKDQRVEEALTHIHRSISERWAVLLESRRGRDSAMDELF
jgi:hypothetical protein